MNADRTFDSMLSQVVTFCDERDWSRFHEMPRVAAALAIECAEVQELFRWKTDEEARQFVESAKGSHQLAQELADVFIFALLFCHVARIDPVAAIEAKLQVNHQRYPVDRARGSAVKHTDL
jgi:dCTP diphosphatase